MGGSSKTEVEDGLLDGLLILIHRALFRVRSTCPCASVIQDVVFAAEMEK